MFDPWVRKILWRRKWQPIPTFSPKNPMGRGVWQATVHGVTKIHTGLSNTAEKHLNLRCQCILVVQLPLLYNYCNAIKLLGAEHPLYTNFAEKESRLKEIGCLLPLLDIHFQEFFENLRGASTTKTALALPSA